MTSTNKEEQAAQLGRDCVRNYYQAYMTQFGQPFLDYLKLLLIAAPEDRRPIHEAYQEAYIKETERSYKEAIAALLDTTVEELDQVFLWIRPPGNL